MANASEFGRYIKQIYPGEYDNYSDEELGKICKKEYPDVYQKFVKKMGNGNLERIQSKYSPDRGLVGSWLGGKAAKYRRKHADQLAREAASATNLENQTYASETSTIEARLKLKHTPKKLKREEKLAVATFQQKRQIAENATKMGVDDRVYLEGKQKHILNGLELELEEGKSKIKLDEHREMKELDHQIFIEQENIKVKTALIASIAPVYQASLLIEQLDKTLVALEHWEKQPDSTRRNQMLEQYNSTVTNLREAINEREKGLLQGDKRGKLS
jgi:hypothetical protein